MKVIFLKDVKGVGRRFEEKEVGDGYATNFLIPKKFAVPSDSPAAAQAKNMKAGAEKHKLAEDHKLHEEGRKLASTTITIKESANDKGHLFATITRDKIAELLKAKGINIPLGCIDVGHGLKETGSHTVPVKIGDKTTHFTLVIEAR